MKFVSVVHPTTGFESFRESKRECSEAGSQTEVRETKDFEGNSKSQDEKEVQTDDNAKEFDATFDEASLSSFLSRVAPGVIKELDKNLKSTAFQGYELLADKDGGRACLSHWLLLPEERISSVDWNPHASRIVTGVASRSVHDDWCKHSGALLHVWNVVGTVDVKLDAPIIKKTTSACVTSVAFHPYELNIVAAGTYNGEILVWDLNREEDMRMASSSKMLGSDAGEAVTCLAFLKKNFLAEAGTGHLSLLASGGLDGKMYLWAVNPVSEEMRLLRKFVMSTDEMTLLPGADIGAREADVGLTCWDFSPSDPSTLIVGGEGGVVALCSFLSTKLVGRADASGDSWKNPISLSLVPHVGNVAGVAFSPVSSDVVASASNDGCIRIFNLKESTSPVLEIQTKLALSCLMWSPSRPLVLLLGTETATVEVFDLMRSRTDSTLSLSLGNIVNLARSAQGSVTCMKLNPKSPRMLCVGTGSGIAAVWKLPETYVSPSQQETTALKELLTEGSIE